MSGAANPRIPELAEIPAQERNGTVERLLDLCELGDAGVGLSNLLAYKEGNGDIEGAELLKQVSPAWQHVNLYGRYEFSKRPEVINMEALIQELARIPITHELTG